MFPLTSRFVSTPRSFVGSVRCFSNSPAMGRQFLVIALDFTDGEAINRRMKERQAHLDRAAVMKQHGQLIFGGALLTADDQMNGSALVYEANDEAEVRRWIADDPYITGRVWNSTEIRQIKLAKTE